MTAYRFALLIALVFVIACGAAQQPAAAQPPSTEQQNEFVPIDELPPQEQMPAAPLLIGAYVFVMGVLFLYFVSLGRRMSAVQREVQRLESDIKRTGRPS